MKRAIFQCAVHVCVWIFSYKNVFVWSLFAGRTAFLGLGFGDRSDSFDLNVALQDHFKWVKNQEKIEQDKVNPKPELDLGFKEGETIKINMKITVSIICNCESTRNIDWEKCER